MLPTAPALQNAVFDSAQSRRLFVTDPGTGEIYLYDVPSLKLVTILQGFESPQGACADDKGDVWVTDNHADKIYKLAYAGKTVGDLTDSTGYPVSCAWDPKTGNLAVTNYIDAGSKSGGLLVYHHAVGSPNTYTNAKQYYYSYTGYDDSGDLYFDGSSATGTFVLSELPYGGDTPETIKVSGAKIYDAGMVEWDAAAKRLDVGDQNCLKAATTCIYQLKVSGTTATATREIGLKTSTGSEVCDVAEAVLSKGELYGSDNDYCGYANSATYGWPYPAGGSPNHDQKRGISEPIGAAMAVQPQTPQRDINPKKLDLLYVAEGTGDVAVFTYLQKTPVATLTGFSKPEGECVDKNNDVYITDAGKAEIVEYAHGGKKPMREIADAPNSSPYGCALDLATGDLAVANIRDGTSGTGNIAVFSNGNGKPTIYTDSAIPEFVACTYDDRGNLLATNGDKTSELSSFAWLPKGGKRLTNIGIPSRFKSYEWEDVQGLQWDGRYFLLDQYDAVSRATIDNAQAYYIGETSLEDEEVKGPYWIYNAHPRKQGTALVGIYAEGSSSAIYYFNYPSGGSLGDIDKGVSDAQSVAISLGRERL
jgi:hypothetical protein